MAAFSFPLIVHKKQGVGSVLEHIAFGSTIQAAPRRSSVSEHSNITDKQQLNGLRMNSYREKEEENLQIHCDINHPGKNSNN
ncbi:hypothetical protein V6N13_110072 [Hibiscus sabdariffa]|uniref:Uncharacterized protein n=1 Tax=Hibiscus sabdariffa TaxID=183260 RepID=A0ABR2BTU5_9ROSI